MRRKIYTRKESLKITWVILGVIVWLCALGWVAPFFWKETKMYVAVLILTGWGILHMAQALKRRKKHQMCVATQTPQKGRIVDCIGETKTRWVIHLNGLATEYLYYLVVEMYPQGQATPVSIRSDAYTWPVYQELASTEVDIYESDTESGYTLDGFQYKSDKTEPDILPESLRKSLPGSDYDPGASVIVVILALLMLILFYIIF